MRVSPVKALLQVLMNSGRNAAAIACSMAMLFLVVSCSPEKPQPLKVGDKAPPFVLESLDGTKVALSDFKGSPVVIRFFLTDCKFCRADTPVLNSYYGQYRGKGLAMLYVDTLGVDRKRLRAFADEFALDFPVLIDSGGKIAGSYRVRALPQTVVLDPDHKILAAILGGISEPELNKLLAPYLD